MRKIAFVVLGLVYPPLVTITALGWTPFSLTALIGMTLATLVVVGSFVWIVSLLNKEKQKWLALKTRPIPAPSTAAGGAAQPQPSTTTSAAKKEPKKSVKSAGGCILLVIVPALVLGGWYHHRNQKQLRWDERHDRSLEEQDKRLEAGIFNNNAGYKKAEQEPSAGEIARCTGHLKKWQIDVAPRAEIYHLWDYVFEGHVNPRYKGDVMKHISDLWIQIAGGTVIISIDPEERVRLNPSDKPNGPGGEGPADPSFTKYEYPRGALLVHTRGTDGLKTYSEVVQATSRPSKIIGKGDDGREEYQVNPSLSEWKLAFSVNHREVVEGWDPSGSKGEFHVVVYDCAGTWMPPAPGT